MYAMKPLEGKIALVTGGSRGIGRSVAIKLATEGAFTYVNYCKNEDAARQTLRKITDRGGTGKLAGFDVAGFEETREVMATIIEENKRIDILVNNAGITIDGVFARAREEHWDKIVNTNLKGTFNCCRAATRHMMKQRWGRIVNVVSVVAESGNAGQVCYAASKAGIVGLTKSLARELGPRHITVNAVAPGFIETDMTRSISREMRDEIVKTIPLGRVGTPEDVAGVVAFLASAEAGYITGQILRVNGGIYM
jgi:3-oxoacyl-[acyl-carrier protein] reductase